MGLASIAASGPLSLWPSSDISLGLVISGEVIPSEVEGAAVGSRSDTAGLDAVDLNTGGLAAGGRNGFLDSPGPESPKAFVERRSRRSSNLDDCGPAATGRE